MWKALQGHNPITPLFAVYCPLLGLLDFFRSSTINFLLTFDSFMSFTNFFFIYLWRLDIIYYWHLGMKFYNWFLPEKNKSKWLYIIHLGRFARCCLWVRNTIKNPSVYMDFVLSLAWIQIVKTWLLQLNSDMVNVEYPLLMFVIHTPPLSNTKR